MSELSPHKNARNLVELFENAVDAYASSDCMLFKDDGRWLAWDWNEVRTRVLSISAGLQGLGVNQGDRIAILSATRPEWTLVDMAILSLGAVSVPVYQSNLADEVAYIVNDADAKGIFVENRAQLEKVLSVRDQLKSLEFIIVIEADKTSGDEILLKNLLLTNPEKATRYFINAEELSEDTIASLVYTSGTTGQPKGVILTHGNFLAEVKGCMEVLRVKPTDASLAFLPLAHIFARVIQFYHIATGYRNAFAESIEQLGENISEIQPDFLVSVPRIFEKVYEKILSQVQNGSVAKRALFKWATKVGVEYSRAKQAGIPPRVRLSSQYLLASRVGFGKISARLGGRMRFAVSGGAPLSLEIAEFFHAAGINILEGYGLTETCAAVHCVSPDRIEFGSVGPSLKGVETKIAEDGEILVRGPMIFKGYYNNDAATQEVLEPDGWFHTGDIGEISSAGSLKITDRKKDIIVTAGGKNIAPQKLENLIKTNRFISQIVVHGDKRKYLTALVTLNQEEVEKYVTEQGVRPKSESLFKHPKVEALVDSIIAEHNSALASYETIKKFAILESDFTQENGELTPSLKVKRRFVTKKYSDILDALY